MSSEGFSDDLNFNQTFTGSQGSFEPDYASQYNKGQGIRYTPSIQPILPLLKPGETRRTNARKPKPVLSAVFYCHEDLDFGSFLEAAVQSVDGKGNLPYCLDGFKVVGPEGSGELRSNTFTISWSVRGKQGVLTNEATYNNMLSQNKGDIKLTIEELDPPQSYFGSIAQAQVPDEGPGNDSGGHTKKHCKVVHEELEEETLKKEFIKKIDLKYRCEDTKCSSPTCFVMPTGSHLLLTPMHVCTWAAAMVAHKENVDIEHPPATPLFDHNGQSHDDIALLARHRRNLSNLENTPNTNANITVNLAGIGELIDGRPVLQNIDHNAPAPPSKSALQPKLSLDVFCDCYNLNATILDKLHATDITGPHSLRFFFRTKS
ncbi:hypothetical protein BT96DRAFT_997819 [Gymnopus androsaceus JB14]|uniref:Uncharacterized protein n=1 Tax=Gymnopus androsaceus JB14 TaxID=1447944 RepID=A0A6A4HDT1_9AGAR|nr:hypothetical protein BT96DRAFT_997819 [Gymnopus androsaceus JB14]